MPTFAFSGGVDAILPYGQKSIVQFGSNDFSWLGGEWWTVTFTSTGAPRDFVAGVGYFDRETPVACYTYQNRVYVACGKRFNFSAIDDQTGAPQYTLWEIQNPGAGFVLFQSQYGNQDGCQAFTQLQGRLAVVGSITIQLWTVDTDPDNFALNQILDNSGTDAVQSPQNLGDYDAFYLDRTGVRNLKTHMETFNSFVDDLGIAIDELIRNQLPTFPIANACSIVDPIQKSYWLCVGDAIYVLSRYIGAKITAWSTFKPEDQDAVPFAPQKFVVFNRKIYCRTVEYKYIQYGGADGLTYDGCVMTVEIPWLDDGTPKMTKMACGVDVAIQGRWTIRAGMDPESYTNIPADLEQVYEGFDVGGTEDKDSTFDRLVIPYNQQGTHFKIIGQTNSAWERRARISEIVFSYNKT